MKGRLPNARCGLWPRPQWPEVSASFAGAVFDGEKISDGRHWALLA